MKDFEPLIRCATPLMPAEPRPIVIIGAGSIVRDAHLPAYTRAGFPVAAIVDRDVARARSLAHSFGIPVATESLQTAIGSASAERIFDLAVPAGSILDVLPHLPDGSAVLIQKPMGNTLAEAEQILAVCRAKGITAAVNFQLRWAPVMMAARAIANAGRLGEIHDVEVRVNVYMPWEIWSFLATAPRLEILYHSIHYVDLLRSWLGNPVRVLAKTVRNPQTPTLSATKSVIVLDFGEWKRAYITANHGHQYPDSQQSYVQWEGTRGVMRAVMGVNLDYPRGKPDSLEFAERGEGWQSLATTGNWFPDAFIGSMASLQTKVSGESSELPTRVEDAIHTMRAVEAAYQSSERDGVTLADL